jgi:hypothetical protein
MMMLSHASGQGGCLDLDVEYSDSGQGHADGSTSGKIAIQPENAARILNGEISLLKIDLRAWADMWRDAGGRSVLDSPARSPFQLS